MVGYAIHLHHLEPSLSCPFLHQYKIKSQVLNLRAISGHFGIITTKFAMLLLLMIGFSALVVQMRESTGTKAVRVSLLKEVQPLTPELGGVVIKAGLPAVGEVGVPVRPVLDISKTLEEVPSIPWVLLL